MNTRLRRTGVIIVSLILIFLLFPVSVFAGGEEETQKETVEAAEPTAEFKEWKLYNILDYEETTGKKITELNEAPMLAEMVAAGEIPKLEDRLPKDLLVVDPVEGIGEYGGTLIMGGINMLEGGGFAHVSDSASFAFPLMGGEKDIPLAFKGSTLSEDGKTYTLYLREGMRWSDGAPATADDIMFWWEDLANLEGLTRSQNQSAYKVGDELPTVTKINDYEVRFQYETGPKWDIHFTYNSYLLHKVNIYPRHILEKYHIKYNKDADKLAKEKGYDNWMQLMSVLLYIPYNAPEEFNLEVPTFGAWRFKKQLPDGMIFERNPYYFTVDTEGNQLPYIDEVKIVSVETSELYQMKALSGELDFANWGMPLSIYPVLAEEAAKGKFRLQLGTGTSQANAGYWFNLHYEEDPVIGKILADKRFRQALSLAIDRDNINETLYYGQGVPTQLTVLPALPYFKEEWARAYADYDPDRANELLDEMGLEWNAQHKYRLRPDGNTLTVEVVTMTNHAPDYIPILEIVKDYWEDVGVIVNVKPVLKQYQYKYADANLFQIRSRANAWLIANPQIANGKGGGIGFGRSAPNWVIWADTNGEAGTEPSEYYKEMVIKAGNLPSITPPSKQEEAIIELAEYQAE